MEKVFKKFFTHNTTLTISSVLSFSILVALAIINCFNKIYEPAIYNTILAICILGLFISYKNHEKNVMKGLIGSVLMGLLFICTTNAFTVSVVNDNSFVTLVNVAIILILILFVLNHFAINSDHHSNPYNIFINQALLIVFAILAIANVFVKEFDLVSLFHNVGTIMLLIVVTCIESKLDAFREIREEKKEEK